MKTVTKQVRRKITKATGQRFNFKTPVFYFKESDSSYYKYCPALELLADGDTEDEANKSFRFLFKVLKEDFERMKKNNTFRTELQRLNWDIVRWGVKKEVRCPALSIRMKNDALLQEMVDEMPFRKEDEHIALTL